MIYRRLTQPRRRATRQSSQSLLGMAGNLLLLTAESLSPPAQFFFETPEPLRAFCVGRVQAGPPNSWRGVLHRPRRRSPSPPTTPDSRFPDGRCWDGRKRRAGLQQSVDILQKYADWNRKKARCRGHVGDAVEEEFARAARGIDRKVPKADSKPLVFTAIIFAKPGTSAKRRRGYPTPFVLQCESRVVARAGSLPGRRWGPLSGVDLPPERWT